MQINTLSKTKLHYIVICHPPVKLKKRYFEDTILPILKRLYNVAEAKNH